MFICLFALSLTSIKQASYVLPSFATGRYKQLVQMTIHYILYEQRKEVMAIRVL